MKDKLMKMNPSRRDWLKAAAAGAGLVVVRPVKSAAAPVSMRVAAHWHPEEEKK